MKSIEHYNPFVHMAYFLAVAGIVMFAMNPVVVILSLAGALTFFFVCNGKKKLSSNLFYLGLFVVLSILNPLFYHNGATVLFFLNDNPITLEALEYGMVSAAAIIAVLYWCRTFSKIMTSDRLLYIFGRLTPKLALVLSGALRFIPLFNRRTEKIKAAQKGVGLYKQENVIDTIGSDIKVFSILVTWGLENGIITADSMSARGYGAARRTSFALYRFRKTDLYSLIYIILMAGIVLAGMLLGRLDTEFYPLLVVTEPGAAGILAYVSYGLLVFTPVILKIAEGIRWKYLLSKI